MTPRITPIFSDFAHIPELTLSGSNMDARAAEPSSKRPKSSQQAIINPKKDTILTALAALHIQR